MVFHWLSPVLSLKIVHLYFAPSDNVAHESITSCSYNNNSCWQMSICFCFSLSVIAWGTHRAHNFQCLRLATIAITRSLGTPVLFVIACWEMWQFLIIPSMSIIGCCSWSPVVLLVVQTGMSEVCTAGTYSSVLSSTVSCCAACCAAWDVWSLHCRHVQPTQSSL
jgi:hypothetical protein